MANHQLKDYLQRAVCFGIANPVFNQLNVNKFLLLKVGNGYGKGVSVNFNLRVLYIITRGYFLNGNSILSANRQTSKFSRPVVSFIQFNSFQTKTSNLQLNGNRLTVSLGNAFIPNLVYFKAQFRFTWAA